MVEGELRAVAVRAAGGEQRACPRMVQARVVQDRQARPAEEVRPEEVVQARVADLVDDQVVLSTGGAPHEIVR